MSTPLVESNGEKLGRLAFAYCKIATVSFICGRFALPVAAGLSGGLFIAAYVQGKTDTRCWGRYPLVVAAFWLCIVCLWLACEFQPGRLPLWITWIHR